MGGESPSKMGGLLLLYPTLAEKTWFQQTAATSRSQASQLSRAVSDIRPRGEAERAALPFLEGKLPRNRNFRHLASVRASMVYIYMYMYIYIHSKCLGIQEICCRWGAANPLPRGCGTRSLAFDLALGPHDLNIRICGTTTPG